jgi:pSer/pThr/pTyr-binding forkhead associated (FHA) protein
VLGRKTTIGRTPDNDLQIDTKFISRHHAVILAAPAHTIIEDLNSTNGIMVNGRRIRRQPLRDGDMVSIGKTQFRFAVRAPAAERRVN